MEIFRLREGNETIMIKIYLRDCNGKRDVWTFFSNYDFTEWYNEHTDDVDEYMYEIQMVIYDGFCVYSGLIHEGITFEELLGFFA